MQVSLISILRYNGYRNTSLASEAIQIVSQSPVNQQEPGP
jgi:hypothetical protein